MEFRRDAHRVYMLTYHLVFVVKYRKPVIDQEMSDYIRDRVEMFLQNNNGILIEFNSDKDHVHILFEISPDINLAHWVRGVKGALGRKIKEAFPEKLAGHLRQDEFWTDSYFLTTTGGAPIEIIKQYIENQGKPKRTYRKTSPRWNKV